MSVSLFRRVLRLVGRPGDFDPSWDHLAVGRWGESWAAWHYFAVRNAAVVARNWRGGGGELDLVVAEKETLVFVEVKTRDPADPEPLAEVRRAPRKRRFRSAAEAYLHSLPRPRPPHRFDVLLVTPDPASRHQPQINCLVDVMAADGGA